MKGANTMKITDLKPADYNPRRITDKQLKMLKKSLEEFGDLSGFVFNRRTGNLISGHQRLKCLPASAVIEKKELPKQSRTGTVAEGYIEINGERFIYREVDWSVEKEKAANIAANKHGGEFDNNKLQVLLEELSALPDFDFELTGFDIEDIVRKPKVEDEVKEWDIKEVYIPFWIVIRGPVDKFNKVIDVIKEINEQDIVIEKSI